MDISGELLNRICLSSVWHQQPRTIAIVWISMILMADRKGFVDALAPGIANTAHVSLEECEVALEFLSSPDPYSEHMKQEGRRIARLDSGWQILDERIRNGAAIDRRTVQNREAQRRFRESRRQREAQA